MEEIKFKSLSELHNRLKPALKTRSAELKLKHFYINEVELWNYFKDHKWKNAANLSLADMVEDILNADIINYSKEGERDDN